MNRCCLILLLLSTSIWGQQNEITVSGKVSDGKNPIPDVNITVADSETETRTDAKGFYRITVSEGAILNYSHVGYETVEIVTEDIGRTLNIIMVPKVNRLDNVTVTKSRPRKTQKELFQEYNTNPNLIKTMFGILDKENIATSLYILDEKDFPPGAIYLGQLLNKLPGFRPSYSFKNEQLPMIEIDGMLYSSDAPVFLDVSNIERIATTSSRAALSKYGTVANGGLIIINTKTGNFSPGSNGITNYDQAKLRNNTYENDAIQTPLNLTRLGAELHSLSLVSKNVEGTNPTYLIRLLESKSETEAKEIYENQRTMHGSSPYYVLDAYDYFSNRWKNREFADSVIEQNKTILENNSHALKALAYIFQAEGRLKKANEIYKEIFLLRPNYAQSYMDLANSYREIEEYQKAAVLYARYAYLVEEGFLRTEGDLGTIMVRELNNLVTLQGDKLLAEKERKKLMWNDEFEGTRITFEWNDSEAEFKLQFVNPGGNYYVSEHSLMANADRIQEEKISGFSCEEYLIYAPISGVWRVNAEYLGNKSLTPTYLKANIYHNYGRANQRKEIKVFKLYTKDVKQQLFKVSNTAGMVYN
ncbi:carboxypeptidase-like regulatory domain-containing protein [Maribacter aestuarii]|uniref:carboxypeptidase-like regulatory domain-containing protein n=1 Tax=Maribacter aestuarii TaxID=1130723 RepID=UPI00248B64CA|nr:carboxypeptidase-like regulatory domain-containing protein [Maribacter aestuarii]